MLTIAEILGHKDLKMTKRSAHVAPTHRLAAIEKLEGAYRRQENTTTLSLTAPIDQDKERTPMNLYWCETADHDEDWFVVASSAKEACQFHEKEEGYGTGDVRATLVRRIPRTLSVRKEWPSHDLLRALGAVFLSESTPRIVEIRSTIYQEGGMDAVINRLSDDYAEAAGMGRLNKTTRLQ